jgi:hypothetical protein
MTTDDYIAPYCHVIYRQGSRIMTKRCFSEMERLEFMLELLFDNTHPIRKYRATFYLSNPAEYNDSNGY